MHQGESSVEMFLKLERETGSSGEIHLGKPTFCGPESLASLEVVSRSTGRPGMLKRSSM